MKRLVKSKEITEEVASIKVEMAELKEFITKLDCTLKVFKDTNRRIYGYQYIEETNSLVQISEEAENIKMIFDCYSDGFGVRQIIKFLNYLGLKTRDGNDFCKTTINRILNNEKYFGGNPCQKYDSGVVFSKESYPKVRDGYEVKSNDRIEAIISEDLFNECKIIRESRQKNSKGVYLGTSKYASKIRCYNCDSVYISDKDGNREYYRCRVKKEKGVDYCNSRNIKKSEIDEKILDDMKNKELENSYNGALIFLDLQLRNLEWIYNADNTDKIKEYKKYIEELTVEIKNAFREYSNKKLLEEIYNEIVSEDNKKIEYYKQELEKLEEPLQKLRVRRDEIMRREQVIKNKMKKAFTEEDYLRYLSVYVLDNELITRYNIPEALNESIEFANVVHECNLLN